MKSSGGKTPPLFLLHFPWTQSFSLHTTPCFSEAGCCHLTIEMSSSCCEESEVTDREGTRCANTVDWNSLRTFLGHCWPWGSHAVDLPWVMGNHLVDCCVGMSTQHCQVPGQSCWAVPSRRVFVPVDFRHTLFTVDSVQKSDWNQHSPSPINGFPSFSPLGKRDSLKLFTEKIKEDRVIKILWQLLMINCHRRTQWQPKLSQSPVSPLFD